MSQWCFRLGTIGVALLASLVAGCGYQFYVEGSGPTIGGAPDSAVQQAPQAPPARLTVQNFSNISFEPQLAVKYTEYLRRQFAAGSGAEVVSDVEEADYLVVGKISSVSIPALSFTTNTTFENRALVTVTAAAKDLRTNKTVWKQSVTGASEYFVTNDLQVNKQLERRAVEQAGEQIAADLAVGFLTFLESQARATQETNRDGEEGSRPLEPSAEE